MEGQPTRSAQGDATLFVPKHKIRVLIDTQWDHIEGFVYLTENQRLSDLLNESGRFVPVTDAVVLSQQQNSPDNPISFLAINKDHVVKITQAL